MTSRKRPVVLDFDGVIVDSMPLHAEAYREVLGPYGIVPSDEDVYRQEGNRSESIIRRALEAAGIEHDDALIKRLGNEKQAAYQRLGPPQPYDDAPDFVRSLHEASDGLAVVTGSRRENIDRLVPDLVELFDVVLAQADYAEDKPHPEPYLMAFEKLGVEASDAAVVENAAYGVRSAAAAGTGLVVGITTTRPAEELREAGADLAVDGHKAAVDAVRDWWERRSRA